MARTKDTQTLGEQLVEEEAVADLEPRFYTANATWGDESLFEDIKTQLAAIHQAGGKVLGVTFQSPSKAGILAYVPPGTETDEDATAS
jgi:hypothetical protein